MTERGSAGRGRREGGREVEAGMKRNRGRDWKARKGERRREGALGEGEEGIGEEGEEGRERRRQGDGKCQAGEVDWRGASRTNDCSQQNVRTLMSK